MTALAIRVNHAQAVLPIAESAKNQTALPALRPRNAPEATASIQNAAHLQPIAVTGNAIAVNPAQAAQPIAAVVLQGLMVSHVQATQNAHQVIVEIVFAATPGKTVVILT